MPQYLISAYLPANYDPSSESPETVEGIHAINRKMTAAGIRKFACGLSPKTTTLRKQSNGEILVTDGPYLEAKEFVGGLSIIEAETLEEALAWAKRGAQFSPAAVEVREVFFRPAPPKD